MCCRASGIALLSLLAVGCYTLRPTLGPMPEVGQRVAFDVNDAGRAALGGAMGPGIERIEGRLLDQDNGSFLVAVSAVRLVRGGEQIWSGEQVRVNREYVATSYERRLSLARSAALGALGVGGLAAFLVSLDLFASGSDEQPPPCNPEIPGSCGAEDRIGRP